MLKHFARIVVFTLAFAGAVVLTGIYKMSRRPSRPSPPIAALEADAPVGRPFGPNVTLASPPVPHKAKLITLDKSRKESYTTLELAPLRSAPQRLWVWACFFVPSASAGAGRCWSSEPVEVLRPFDNGGPAMLTVKAPCAWCGEAGVPENGFFAIVRVSTVSAEDARATEDALNFDIATATPVVVQEPRTRTSKPASVVVK